MQFQFEKYQFFVGILQIQMEFPDFPFVRGLNLEFENQLATRDFLFHQHKSGFDFLLKFHFSLVSHVVPCDIRDTNENI